MPSFSASRFNAAGVRFNEGWFFGGSATKEKHRMTSLALNISWLTPTLNMALAGPIKEKIATAAEISVWAVAGLHVFFLILEMFFWETRFAFGFFEHPDLKILEPKDPKLNYATITKTLAMNQGLYNGFLAAGLVWGLLLKPPAGHDIQIFFLSCVVVAGIYGAVTLKRPGVFFLQGAPAAIALALIFLS